jgi:hypothetical protein
MQCTKDDPSLQVEHLRLELPPGLHILDEPVAIATQVAVSPGASLSLSTYTHLRVFNNRYDRMCL